MRKAAIYTRTGDKGNTSLVGGKRVSKSSDQLEAYGDIDELNSCLGYLASLIPQQEELQDRIRRIQNELFTLGGIMASESGSISMQIPSEWIANLEHQIDSMTEELSPIEQFIIPGGSAGSCYAQVCRTVCRRSERSVVRFVVPNELAGYEATIHYLNRLSDWLFVLARLLNKSEGYSDFYWIKDGY